MTFLVYLSCIVASVSTILTCSCASSKLEAAPMGISGIICWWQQLLPPNFTGLLRPLEVCIGLSQPLDSKSGLSRPLDLRSGLSRPLDDLSDLSLALIWSGLSLPPLLWRLLRTKKYSRYILKRDFFLINCLVTKLIFHLITIVKSIQHY